MTFILVSAKGNELQVNAWNWRPTLDLMLDMNPADIDANELYSATYEWLETFAKFCRSSGGFKVV
jgi:hypothetical protein